LSPTQRAFRHSRAAVYLLLEVLERHGGQGENRLPTPALGCGVLCEGDWPFKRGRFHAC
jgi:hypothetical protein